jgi:hypothetical protein
MEGKATRYTHVINLIRLGNNSQGAVTNSFVNMLAPRASTSVRIILLLMSVLSVRSAINETFSSWNTSAGTVIDDIIVDSTQKFMYVTSRAKSSRVSPDLLLTVLDISSLKSMQTLSFPGCTTVQSPVESSMATFPYFQSYDGVVQKSENAIVLCRNDTGTFLFEIVHKVSTWPSTWSIGRTWCGKDPKHGAGAGLYTSFSSFQPPLSPNIAGSRMPIIGTSGKIYFLGKWQSTRLLMAINLDTFSLEEVGMFASGVNVLDLLSQPSDPAKKGSSTVDWLVSTADADAVVSIQRLSLANLPSLELIDLPPIAPAPHGFAGSFHLPLPVPPIAQTPALLRRNSSGVFLSSNGDKLNPRPSIFKFDSTTATLGASLTITNTTYVAASAGISGREPCGYLFGPDLLRYHVNNTLTQFTFTEDPGSTTTAPTVIDSISTPALGNWPGTYNFKLVALDTSVVAAFDNQIAKFEVSCRAGV